ncbi:Zn(2)-C6 fungal-type domain-containing protein [Mycena indigotica]|uniref:Zn(2)-C6 fungal-type domain-containing protein n=1 Tax=Mycena indigotica TaxID=2126181 RepID=A0A8H6RXW4_9AGAR|nr:Zn(2)-C6 fungal-type domain-containing protein [Mycena indigotica]KAF7288615.1 Zn(2)-C6 fungal-type domain-containing protein [Mycena indigotica]
MEHHSTIQDEVNALPAVPVKKRRIQRACDSCRQKRRACDGLRSATKRCSFCAEAGVECVYSGAQTTTKKRSYTEVLEGRLAQMEEKLKQFTETSKPGWSAESSVTAHGSTTRAKVRPGLAVEFAAMTIRAANAAENLEDGSDDEVTEELRLAKELSNMKISSHREQFMGKSSGAMLVKTAMDLKMASRAGKGKDPSNPATWLGEGWTERRMEYWSPVPWTLRGLSRPRYVFPPPDLLADLVALYFEHANVYVPLLHRPTFTRLLARNGHLEDDKVGAIVLIVCAIGARFSPDPRVLGSNAAGGGTTAQLACGWQYFSQLSTELEFMFETPGLYDLQRYCLAIHFLEGCATQAMWPLIGVGLRIAEEVGAHRRQMHGAYPGSTNTDATSDSGDRLERHSVEAELWRRAFWALVYYDRLVSCTLGRPCGVQWDDFDLQLPTPVDDSAWAGEVSDPAQAWRQPKDVPSSVAFFNAMLKLNNILGFVLRLLYSIDKKSGMLRADDDRWEEHIVAELDSALNKWVDEIPEHLRWDPQRQDHLFFKQSVALYCAYYHVQMTIHRPFIPMLRRDSRTPTGLPSLAICTNAARSCAHVADVWTKRTNGQPAVNLLPALTMAGVVLLLNVWSVKRTGLPPHMNTAVDEVKKIMAAIRVCEARWQMAGLFWDILAELANVGQVPLNAQRSGPSTVDNPSVNSTPGTSEKSVGRTSLTSGHHESPAPNPEPRVGGMNFPAELPPDPALIYPTAPPVMAIGSPSPFTSTPPTPPTSLSASASTSSINVGSKRAYSALEAMYAPAPAAVPYEAHWSAETTTLDMGMGGLQEWADQAFAWVGAPGEFMGTGGETLPMHTAELGGGYSMWEDVGASGPVGPVGEDLGFGGAMNVWANAPPGLAANDWGTYFSMVNAFSTHAGQSG